MSKPKAKPKPKCTHCRRIIDAKQDKCLGCKRLICVRCALHHGHFAGGMHR